MHRLSFASRPRGLAFVYSIALGCAGACSYSESGYYGSGPSWNGNAPPASPARATVGTDPTDAERYWLQLSSDDSTSMASAQVAKSSRAAPTWFSLHRHEVVNYYDPPPGLAAEDTWPLQASPSPTVQLSMQVVLGPPDASPRTAELLVHLEAAAVAPETRRPYHLVYCVDVSGSMGGAKIDYVRDGLLRSLDHLRDGDLVSFVTFESVAHPVFEGLQWPRDEAEIRSAFEAIEPLGSTDMRSGLVEAYRMAAASPAPEHLRRVLLFGDGQANVGATDVDHFRTLTRDGDREGTYLTAIGVGSDFDWRMMDRLADAGKGASVFLPDAAETERLFGAQFPKLVEVAADEVEVELVLPVGLRLADFSGEETSTDPNARVASVILAAGDDITMLARFEVLDPAALDRPVDLTLSMRPLTTDVPVVYEASTTFQALETSPGPFFDRMRIVDGYGRRVAQMPNAPTAAVLTAAIDAYPGADPGLLEIRGLLGP